MSGLRKTGLINTMIKYNQLYNLGLINSELAELTTGQLKRKTKEVREAHGITVKTTSRYGD